MKESLTTEELKSLCEYFFSMGEKYSESIRMSAGGRRLRDAPLIPFEEAFNTIMQGKYDAAIKQRGIERQWYEMQQEIEKHMESFDREAKIRAHQAAEDLGKFIITT